MATLPDVPGLRQQTQRFRAKLVDIAKKSGVNPDHLAAVIAFETGGTWDPGVRNPHSSAVGLIQWTRAAAKAVHGLTLEEIASRTASEQLDLVGEWYRKVALPLGEPVCTATQCAAQDAYLAVFAPGHLRAHPDDVLYSAPSRAYEANRGLDADNDGVITAGEAAGPVVAMLASAAKRPRLDASPSASSLWPLLLFGVATAGVVWWHERA